jgi:hypothetical protein
LTILTSNPATCTEKSTTHTFVDLAGSESFASVSANAGINKGNLALSKVLTALASGSKHVPFRDSPLTKLLQRPLCSSAVTLLSCINPDEEALFESRNTLRCAALAASIATDATESREVYVPQDDPLNGDVVDPSDLDRRVIAIPTSFGDVVARAVGDVGDPLVLYVGRSSMRASEAAASTREGGRWRARPNPICTPVHCAAESKCTCAKCDLAGRRGGSGGLPPTARDFARSCRRRTAATRQGERASDVGTRVGCWCRSLRRCRSLFQLTDRAGTFMGAARGAPG